MLNPSEGSQTAVPAFIAKLWHMVSDPGCDKLISWGADGTTFVINDHNKFSSELLPMYYKHNNMASFIRQLNMYSFHKVLLVESPTLKNQNVLEFYHPNFLKGQPGDLAKIQRKIHTKDQSDVKCDPVVFNNLLKEVKQLRMIQELFSSKLNVMKKENAALWREHSILRQRHAKQEKIVNKVIHFLVSMVQQSTFVTRRKVPLMIKDRPILKPSHRKKFVKVGNQKPFISEIDVSMLKDANGKIVAEEILPEELLTYEESEMGAPEEEELKEPRGKKRKHGENDSSYILPDLQDPNSFSPSSSANESIPSPEECLLVDDSNRLVTLLEANGDQSQSADNMEGLILQNVKQEGEAEKTQDYLDIASLPVVTSPGSSVSSPPPSQTVIAGMPEVPSPSTLSPTSLLQLAKPADIHETIKNQEDAELHLDKVQSDLDILKELLKGEGISLDANMVLELFNDHPLDLNMGPPGQGASQPQPSTSDPNQALISYSPSLLDLETDLPESQPSLSEDPTTDFILNTPQIGSQSPPTFPDPL